VFPAERHHFVRHSAALLREHLLLCHPGRMLVSTASNGAQPAMAQLRDVRVAQAARMVNGRCRAADRRARRPFLAFALHRPSRRRSYRGFTCPRSHTLPSKPPYCDENPRASQMVAHDAAAADVSVSVAVKKPTTRRRRCFMGVTWAETTPVVGVRVADTFVGMPVCGCLVGGDVILRVAGEPVSTPEDVVFHWHRASAGEIVFVVHRTETHRLCLSRTAVQNLTVQWLAKRLPIVGATNATPAWLRTMQAPAAPQPGDLLLSIDGEAVSTTELADAAFARAAARQDDDRRSLVDISVLRGVPKPLVGEEGRDCGCCPWLGTVTRVPTRRHRSTARSKTNSTDHIAEVLLEEPPAGDRAPRIEPHA